MSRDKEDERKIVRRSQSYVEQFSAKSDEVAGHWRQQDAGYNVLPLVIACMAAIVLLAGCGVDMLATDELPPSPQTQGVANVPGTGAYSVGTSENYSMVQNLGGLPVAQFNIR